MMKIFNILFLGILLLFFQGISAQSSTREKPIEKVEIPDSSIQKYKDNPDFNYEPRVQNENIITKAWKWIKNQFYSLLKTLFDWIFGVKLSGKYLKKFLASLPYLAIIIFAFLLYRFLLGSDLLQLGNAKNKRLGQVNISDDERLIQEENLDELIQKAIQNKNYRLAVRYSYLKTLKYLIQQSLIDWQPEKTNRDYVKEVQKTPYDSFFRKLTFTYDYIWYGKFNPDEQEFKQIKDDFTNFYTIKE